MDYFLDNWGSFVSALGLVATVVGLIIVFRRAAQASRSAEASRDAATAARTAARATREAIGAVLTIVDLDRAIALVQRLKQLHRESKWEVSLELYQPLRVMLTNINARSTIDRPELGAAILQIRLIEDRVTRAQLNDAEPIGASNFPRVLNDIQASLEEIASSAQPG